MMIVGYTADVDSDEPLAAYLSTRIGKEIDNAFQVPDPRGGGGRVNAVQVGEYYYVILEDENGNYRIEEMNTDLGVIEGGITLATPENFNGDGTMNFNPRRKWRINFSI